ncbi:endosome-associated-trafficking regulator 1 isoform X1 [Trachemys scripta elegans]|uniref:endosome-associated-trafficking regulator 1 isoform X1 n=1 Tax=Trachemys scripta elegans TaxID=31138 RepID=UPI0015536D68|nr:endosome-associated-trafficking regulator 1 isoform X1 [Trachemys scripta elegans]
MAGHSRAPRSPSPNPQLWGGEEPGAANPFSFREFVRSQGRGAAPRGASPQAAAPPPPLRLHEPFFPDPSAGDTRPDEEDAEWSGCYQPAAVERAHWAGPGSASPGPSALESFYGARPDWSGLEDSAPWQLDESDPLGYAEQSLASGGEAGEGPCHPLPPACRDLQEENARLRSKINQLHFFSEIQTDKVKTLEKKLEENKIKEQKEARDLEAMVQHVEENLQLMTKRAVKAENNVIKLKQENALLQVQLKNYKTENEALKTGQSASLAVVKQNADIALQNLLRVITNSRSSIKQLVSGAESLQVVAELLKSIDRISEISDDGP